jgi:hypothetical protein
LPDSHEIHTHAPVLLEVERFEQVKAGAERVLLRLDGRYGDRPGRRVLDARLFVDDGLAVHRHSPIEDDAPGADDDAWLWRAAFEVPTSYLTDARTRFAIESEPGSLIDLPRPADAPASSRSMALSARSAQLARRYAAAIAIVLTVAVAPGGLPAHARTEVIRVHRADGTIAYVTSDGQTIGVVPPDATVVDQAAPAPAPAPTPTPAPAPAPSQAQPAAPAATPAMTQGQQPSQAPAASDVNKASKPAPAQHAAKPDRTTAKPHTTHTHPSTSARNGQPATPQATTTATPKGPNPSQTHTRRHHPAAPAAAPMPTVPPESVDSPLTSLPQMTVATAPTIANGGLPGLVAQNDTQKLQPIHSLDGGKGTAAPAPAAPASAAPAPAPPASTGGPPATMDGIPEFVAPPSPVTETTSTTDTTKVPPAADHGPATPPQTHTATPQTHTGSRHPAPPPQPESESNTGGTAPPSHTSAPISGGNPSIAPGSIPAAGTPGTNGAFFNSLPGPGGKVQGVPNFVIQQFHVPPFLLSIYQAAGIQYGIRWEVLAAINEIETDYGRNLNVSSAGALGWMQFMPATWRQYGVDANKDGKSDPYNPVDAIFAAARYLKAAGGDKDIRRGIFAYNHATWYVDSVMLRARLIAGYPPDLIGSLTGLTEGRFPVAARARYANDSAAITKQVGAGQNAANIVDSSATRRGIDIYAAKGAPVVAVNDGVIKEIGRSKAKGNYVVLQDAYGNRYTYSHLGSTAKLYPVPKQEATQAAAAKSHFQAVAAHDPKPTIAATQGAQKPGTAPAPARAPKASKRGRSRLAAHARQPVQATLTAVKQRLFAHPSRPASKSHGGIDQLLASGVVKGFETYDNYFSHGLGLNSKNAVLKRLKKGSHVVGSTVLGRVGGPAKPGQGPSFYFEIEPAGKGAPKIDPKPFLDGWKLLESTAVYRSKGGNVLYGNGNYSIGEIMLLPKALLQKRVLSDPRIKIYAAGRQDIATGQIDRRVLVVLAYLAESGLDPTVSCLRSGHSMLTTSGNVSEHTSGNAVDISAVNGIPITGHQNAGGIAEQTVKRLMQLQGTTAPHQIISLLDFGQNTLALPDHYNHIHVGFHPLFGTNTKLGRETQSVLNPGQWDTLVQRLGQIQNPSVPTRPSRYAIPNRNGRGQ